MDSGAEYLVNWLLFQWVDSGAEYLVMAGYCFSGWIQVLNIWSTGYCFSGWIRVLNIWSWLVIVSVGGFGC